MAYTLEQHFLFALALARHGGNVTAARVELRQRHRSCAHVSDATLYRFMSEQNAREMIDDAARNIELHRHCSPQVLDIAQNIQKLEFAERRQVELFVQKLLDAATARKAE